MALFSKQITVTGGVDSLATLLNLGGAVKKGIRQLTIQTLAANAAANIGSLADVTAGNGITLAAGSTGTPIVDIAGPFSGNASTNLDEWYIKGTNTNKFNVLLITP